MTTEHLLNGIGIALGLIAFGVITYVEMLNKRDDAVLNGFDEFITSQEASILAPVKPLEGPLTDDQRMIAEAIEIVNKVEPEALRINKLALLAETAKLRERQASRRYFTLAGVFTTAAAFVVEFIALFS